MSFRYLSGFLYFFILVAGYLPNANTYKIANEFYRYIGLGRGYALVPGLIYLFGAPVYITMGTSLAIMVPMAIVGGSIKLVQGYVFLGAALLLANGHYKKQVLIFLEPAVRKEWVMLFFFVKTL